MDCLLLLFQDCVDYNLLMLPDGFDYILLLFQDGVDGAVAGAGREQQVPVRGRGWCGPPPPGHLQAAGGRPLPERGQGRE